MDELIRNAENLENWNPQRQLTIPYVNPTQGKLPIVASGKLSGYTFLGKNYLNLVKECGVNIVQSMLGTAGRPEHVECNLGNEANKIGYTACGFPYSETTENGSANSIYGVNLIESVKNCSDVGVKMIVRISGVAINSLSKVDPFNDGYSLWRSKCSDWRRLVSMFKNDGTVVGWQLQDEPMVDSFWGFREVRYTILEEENGLFQETDHNIGGWMLDIFRINEYINSIKRTGHKICYCNLLPYINVLPSTNPDEVSRTAARLSGVLPKDPYEFSSSDSYPFTEYWGAVNNYAEYVDSYQSNLCPGLICVDAYPFDSKPASSTNEAVLNESLNPMFFRTLGFYLNYRQTQGVSFWWTILTNSVRFYNYDSKTGATKFDHQTDCNTIEKLRFSMFSALAFGAEGLMYWSMSNEDISGSKLENGDPVEKYSDLPITSDCKTTSQYSRLKTVTDIVRKYEKIFIKDVNDISQSVDACVTEWPTSLVDDIAIYKKAGLKRILPAAIPMTSPFDAMIKSINSPGKGWIVSRIEKATHIVPNAYLTITEYIIIVNMDHVNSQYLEINFNQSVSHLTNENQESQCLAAELKKNQINGNVEFDKFDNEDVVKTILPITQYKGYIAPGDWSIFSRKYQRKP